MHARLLIVAGTFAAASAVVLAGGQADPFAFFEPSVTLDERDWTRLSKDDVIVRVPADDGHGAHAGSCSLCASSANPMVGVGELATAPTMLAMGPSDATGLPSADPKTQIPIVFDAQATDPGAPRKPLKSQQARPRRSRASMADGRRSRTVRWPWPKRRTCC
jgi:hypothetical protein